MLQHPGSGDFARQTLGPYGRAGRRTRLLSANGALASGVTFAGYTVVRMLGWFFICATSRPGLAGAEGAFAGDGCGRRISPPIQRRPRLPRGWLLTRHTLEVHDG